MEQPQEPAQETAPLAASEVEVDESANVKPSELDSELRFEIEQALEKGHGKSLEVIPEEDQEPGKE